MNIPIYNEPSNAANGDPSTTGETRANENLNTGSSQTSGGEYLLEGESVNQDGQQIEEKISTQSFNPI